MLQPQPNVRAAVLCAEPKLTATKCCKVQARSLAGKHRAEVARRNCMHPS